VARGLRGIHGMPLDSRTSTSTRTWLGVLSERSRPCIDEFSLFGCLGIIPPLTPACPRGDPLELPSPSRQSQPRRTSLRSGSLTPSAAQGIAPSGQLSPKSLQSSPLCMLPAPTPPSTSSGQDGAGRSTASTARLSQVPAAVLPGP